MEGLNSLANTNCFSILQEKLNDWKYEFEHNCCEANISRCCELLELNARIQTQLFKLLGFCGIYSGLGGSEVKLRNQLIPYLGRDYLENGLTSNTVLGILHDVNKQTRKVSKNTKKTKKNPIQRKSCSKERFASHSPPNCCGSNSFTDEVKQCPKAANQNIYDRLNELEDIIIDLSNEPKPIKKRTTTNRSSSPQKICENKIESLKDVIPPSDIPGDLSGSDVEEIRNDTYLQGLVATYNDLFSQSRIYAMDHLRKYNDDHENNQRLLFGLVMTAAKCVIELQRSYRSTYKLQQNAMFREPISCSVLKNLRTQVVYELINNRGNYFRFYVHDNFSFLDMESFVNQIIQLFWNFGGAKNGLHLLEAADGEMFDEHKYRRSHDSDYNAPLVNHHIWPCLLQSHRVLVKGEACTRASSKMLPKKSICSPGVSSPS